MLRKFTNLYVICVLISLKCSGQSISFNTPKKGENVSQYTFLDEKNEPVTLDSFKGKFIYVEFWASWCGVCTSETPSMNQLKEELKEQNIVSVKISIDRIEEKWRNAMKIRQIGGTNYWLGLGHRFSTKNEIIDYHKKLDIYSVPRYWLVNTEGIIIDADAPKPSKYLEKDKLLRRLYSQIENQ